jgi:hypothetical protein
MKEIAQLTHLAQHASTHTKNAPALCSICAAFRVWPESRDGELDANKHHFACLRPTRRGSLVYVPPQLSTAHIMQPCHLREQKRLLWLRGLRPTGLAASQSRKPREIQTPFDRHDTLLTSDTANPRAITNVFGNARHPIWLLPPESYMSVIQVLLV